MRSQRNEWPSFGLLWLDLAESVHGFLLQPNGKLPVYVPEQVLFQRLSQCDWTVTVNPLAEKLLGELISKNGAASVSVIDFGLEDIFKDILRGSRVQKRRGKPMIWALVQKDLRLLRFYLFALVVVLLLCFVFAGIVTIMILENKANIWDESTVIFAATLSGGSFLSFFVNLVFASLFSGSTVPLERADRSSQFLASLPPTRLQIFSSKLLVVLSIVSISFGLCLLMWFVANRIIYWEIMAADRTGDPSTLSDLGRSAFGDSRFLYSVLSFALSWDDVILHPFLAAFSSVLGVSLLASLWSSSNAAPTILGVLTSPVIFLAFSGVMYTWFPDFPVGPSMIAFSIVSSSIGLGCIIAAVNVYLSQREY